MQVADVDGLMQKFLIVWCLEKKLKFTSPSSHLDQKAKFFSLIADRFLSVHFPVHEDMVQFHTIKTQKKFNILKELDWLSSLIAYILYAYKCLLQT